MSGASRDENPVASLISHGLEGNDDSAQQVVDNDDIPGPKGRTEEVFHCQFSSWYPTFSNRAGTKRKNITIPSVVVDCLPVDFNDYLLSDGVRLPLDATRLSSCAPPETAEDDWSSEDEENIHQEDDNDSNSSEPLKQFNFPQLNQQITTAIESLGGAVVPKLNWSAPKDATWVNGGTLKCKTPGDIYLLIKSSDFCLHDVLLNAWKDCDDHHETSRTTPPLQLVLRKWCNLHPSMEFRCFVRQHEVVAISQRNHTQHYPHLFQDVPRIEEQLLDFFEESIRYVFADGNFPNYVLDVYLDQKERIWVLDFNIWARSTDSLLFTWSELLTVDVEDEPQFRIVETNQQVRQDPLASYRAPIDAVDLASMAGGDANQFEKFMKECQKPSERGDIDEEDPGGAT